jgi:hypothetical protein
VLDDGWGQRMNVTRRGVGTGMTLEEVAALSEAADVGAVQAYRDAVGLRTREVAAAPGPAGWNDPVRPADTRADAPRVPGLCGPAPGAGAGAGALGDHPQRHAPRRGRHAERAACPSASDLTTGPDHAPGAVIEPRPQDRGAPAWPSERELTRQTHARIRQTRLSPGVSPGESRLSVIWADQVFENDSPSRHRRHDGAQQRHPLTDLSNAGRGNSSKASLRRKPRQDRTSSLFNPFSAEGPGSPPRRKGDFAGFP